MARLISQMDRLPKKHGPNSQTSVLDPSVGSYFQRNSLTHEGFLTLCLFAFRCVPAGDL